LISISIHLLPTQPVESFLRGLRSKKTILDRDLATLYGVKPIALRQQVKRNIERFPEDFMFQLSNEEVDDLLSMEGTPFSASLATLEIEPSGPGALLRYTEQAAFFDGADGPAMREQGWNELLNNLANFLSPEQAN
jgi:hypothetical protein